MSQPVCLWLAVIQRLLQCIQYKIALHAGADLPAHNPPGEYINHKGHISEAPPGRYIGEVRNPELIGTRCAEVAIDPILRADQCPVRTGDLHCPAPPDTTKAHIAHQSLYRAAGNPDAFTVKLTPDLVGAVDLMILLPHPVDVDAQGLIPLYPLAASGRIAATGIVIPVG